VLVTHNLGVLEEYADRVLLLQSGRITAIGSPADVIEQLERRAERLSTNFFIFRVGWPGMENYKQLKVIELMGEHVLPYFHKKYGRA